MLVSYCCCSCWTIQRYVTVALSIGPCQPHVGECLIVIDHGTVRAEKQCGQGMTVTVIEQQLLAELLNTVSLNGTLASSPSHVQTSTVRNGNHGQVRHDRILAQCSPSKGSHARMGQQGWLANNIVGTRAMTVQPVNALLTC
jgi:hypothetical protein